MLPPPNSLSELITRHDPQLVMQTISTDRTTAWGLLVEATAAPSDHLVGRLRNAALATDLRQAAAWLDDAWEPDALRHLRQLGRELTSGALEELHAAAGPDILALSAECATVHASCREELAAWQEARPDDAKRIRVAQLDLVAADSPLRRRAQSVAASGSGLALLGALVLAYLRLETGR